MFYERLIAVCEQKGEKVFPVVSAVCGSSGTIANWKRGGTPSGDTVGKLAKHLGTTCDYLLGLTDDPMLEESKPMKQEEAYGCDPIPVIRDFVKLFDQVRAANNYNNDRIARLDGEMQDILHEIELSEDMPKETGSLVERMREIRQERRECKDENERIQPFLDWMGRGHDYAVRNELTAMQGRIAGIMEKQQLRCYVPRVRTEKAGETVRELHAGGKVLARCVVEDGK